MPEGSSLTLGSLVRVKPSPLSTEVQRQETPASSWLKAGLWRTSLNAESGASLGHPHKSHFSSSAFMSFPFLCFLFEDPSFPLCGPQKLEVPQRCTGLRANYALPFSTPRSVALYCLIKIIHGRHIYTTGIGKECIPPRPFFFF